MDKSKKYPLLDEIGGHFLDQAVEQVRRGRKFVFVLDNIDWVVKVNDMRSDIQNKSVHAVATSLVFDRVEHLPDCGPQRNLANCNMKELITPTDAESAEAKERYKILLARILCALPAFSFLSDLVPPYLPVRYRDEMSTQSDVIPLPVLMKDEKKYADVIDVLDQLETWLHEIFSKAGLCALPAQENAPPGPPVEAPSRPDQPAAHIPPELDACDPLANIKVPCFGDQLTRVRFAGAKDLRAGTHTAKDRLDHLYPFRIVDWHY